MVPYQGQQIDLSPPWRRVSMSDLVKETCDVDFYPFILAQDTEGARRAANETAHIAMELLAGLQSAGEILNCVFEHRCESKLIQPTFVTDQPVEVSPLAKPHRTKKGLVERFEMFMVGREHANAFSELTDPIDQRERFNVQVCFPGLHALSFPQNGHHSIYILCPPFLLYNRLRRRQRVTRRPAAWTRTF